jgi:hypothetical protein
VTSGQRARGIRPSGWKVACASVAGMRSGPGGVRALWERRRPVVIVTAAVVVVGAVVASATVLGMLRPAPLGPSAPAPATASTTHEQAAPSPSASPSSPSALPLLVVVDGDRLKLVGLDGRDVASTTVAGGVGYAVAAGAAAAFVDANQLKSLHRDGSVETLATFAGAGGMPIAVAPGGRQWIWSDNALTGSTTRSSIHLSGTDGSDSVVESLTDPTASRALRPYRWDSGGAVIEHGAVGIGGYILYFGATGDVDLLDPASRTVTPLWSGPCVFQARASDGTIACLSQTDSGIVLKVGRPPGVQISIPLNRARFGQAGAISFKPGPTASLLVIGGARSNPDSEEYYTDLVDVAGDGNIRRFGPDGLRPGNGEWAWLDDGSLIEYGPGTPAVTYVVAPDGRARQVTAGHPVGVVRG